MAEAHDIVIVGGGTAGCVLANRLSALPGLSVLLLEAGPPDRSPWIRIPIGFSRTFRDPSVNWCFETTGQAALRDRRVFWPRGRVLGGSSAINGMIHIRGHPDDFDEWERSGLRGWSWRDVLPYFRRAEGQLCALPEVYGSDGPLAVSDVPVRNEATEAFIASAAASGLPRVRTFNTPTQEGAGFYQINTRNGVRCSASSAYLQPVRARANLAVRTGALAVDVELSDRRATGVRYVIDGALHRVAARRLVVLAAGVVGSCALLQRSGIGAPDDLAAAGVAVRVASPRVGRNLQDHFGVRYIARLKRPITVNDDFRRPWRLVGHALDYALRRRGQLAIGGAEAGAFARTSADAARPDVQFHFLPLSNERSGWTFHPYSGVTANVCQLRPHSRGSLRIVSPDPATPPLIDPAYLTDERDLRALVAGLRLARRIFALPPLSDLVQAEMLPGSKHARDDDLADYVREFGSTVFHPVGTCAMGAADDAVLDGECRVRGVGALRVIDASSMPTLVSGNTNAAVTMLAERMAERLLRESDGCGVIAPPSALQPARA